MAEKHVKWEREALEAEIEGLKAELRTMLEQTAERCANDVSWVDYNQEDLFGATCDDIDGTPCEVRDRCAVYAKLKGGA